MKIKKWSLAIKEGEAFTIYGEYRSEKQALCIAEFLPPILEWKIIPVSPSFEDVVEAYAEYQEMSLDAAVWELVTVNIAANNDDILKAITELGIESDFDREDTERLLR